MNDIYVKNNGGSWFTDKGAVNFVGGFNVCSKYNALGVRLCGVL